MQMVLGEAVGGRAVDLAGRVEWQVLEDDDLFGRLVTDAVATERDDVG